ncbi:hypothetical protein MGU_10989 [Metarhizium guizhouense ARSEF 977]|uniref:Uncharacterized protein n=1 Tax=Metarhizium guizhouense (strain ARSEF 977) TaxID=1276136 RepID=A0A0B4GPK5_METGA|nr:hypothetical protein MGU_10989 [Metarhizium guizhouense ARSEF 977]
MSWSPFTATSTVSIPNAAPIVTTITGSTWVQPPAGVPTGPTSSTAIESKIGSSGAFSSQQPTSWTQPTGGSPSTNHTTHVDGSNMQPTTTAIDASTPSSGVPAGAVAGIAIGCAAIGLLSGLLAACILLRRKGRHKGRTADTVVVRHEPKKYSSEIPSDVQLNQFLPEATPDRDIAQEVRSLGGLIQQHVDNYYHSKPVNASFRSLSATLQSLGLAGVTSSSATYTQNIAALCLDPKTRQSALCHVIMCAAFGSIDFHSQNSLLPSMLPRPVASFRQAMFPTGRGRSADAQVAALALRKWRSLSVFLLHPSRNLRTPLPIDNAAVTLQAEELAKVLNPFLRIFVETDPGVIRQQGAHLEAVIVECTKLGYVLLSHPCDWGLVTEVAQSKQGVTGLVVEAGLEKLSDRDGPPYTRPRPVVEPVAVYYDSTG